MCTHEEVRKTAPPQQRANKLAHLRTRRTQCKSAPVRHMQNNRSHLAGRTRTLPSTRISCPWRHPPVATSPIPRTLCASTTSIPGGTAAAHRVGLSRSTPRRCIPRRSTQCDGRCSTHARTASAAARNSPRARGCARGDSERVLGTRQMQMRRMAAYLVVLHAHVVSESLRGGRRGEHVMRRCADRAPCARCAPPRNRRWLCRREASGRRRTCH